MTLTSGWHYQPVDYDGTGEEYAAYPPIDEAECFECGTNVAMVLVSREDTYGREYETAQWCVFWVDTTGHMYCEDCAEDLQ